jgi:hypothetical protein
VAWGCVRGSCVSPTSSLACHTLHSGRGVWCLRIQRLVPMLLCTAYCTHSIVPPDFWGSGMVRCMCTSTRARARLPVPHMNMAWRATWLAHCHSMLCIYSSSNNGENLVGDMQSRISTEVAGQVSGTHNSPQVLEIYIVIDTVLNCP